MLQKVPPPSEFSGYNLYTQRLPEKIRKLPKQRINYIHQLFQKEVLTVKLVDEIILLPLGRGWGYKQADHGVQILVYGPFRSEYKIITTFAEIIADFYAETLFSPFVVPIKKKIWRDYLYKDKKLTKILGRKGIIAFSRLYHERKRRILTNS